jgi:hypothetical protein
VERKYENRKEKKEEVVKKRGKTKDNEKLISKATGKSKV